MTINGNFHFCLNNINGHDFLSRLLFMEGDLKFTVNGKASVAVRCRSWLMAKMHKNMLNIFHTKK